MRTALALAAVATVVAVAVAGCSDLFHGDKAPEGLTCSSAGTCPPGQQCVPSEHVCRTPCTQTSLASGMMTGPNSNQQCQGLNSGSSLGGWNCDYDHFCRPSCNSGGLNGTCSGCSGTDVCDTTVNICRPACGLTLCPTGWGCVDVNSVTNGNTTAMVCAGCRPTAMTTFTPPSFAPVVFYDGLSPQTNPVVVGDLTGGGRPDVLTSDGPGKHLYVFANDGSGGLMPAVSYPVSVTPFHAVVADMNRDGKPDVVVATADAPAGGPVLFPGNGDHTLGAEVAGPMLPTTRLIRGDFDGDGKDDVAACGAGTSQLSIVTSDGAGGLKQLAAFSMNGGATSYVRLGAFDLTGDGHLDLWGDDEHGNIRLFQSNGNASSLGFSEVPNLSAAADRFDSASADLDGDGKTDFIWVSAPNATATATIGVAKNSGGMIFNTMSSAAQLPLPGVIAIADFDGDGHVDVAELEAAANGKSNVDILSNDGSRLTFSEQISIGKGGPQSIATTDLDSDGKPDLVIGLGGGGVAVLINNTPAR